MRNHRVAIQGALASYHDLAAKKFYGEDVDIVECLTFKETCTKIVDNSADYAVMAIENSMAGSILSNYNLIDEYQLKIVGELYVRIEFHLLALPNVSLNDIAFVHSHPMAIAQCQNFASAHQHMKFVELGDTASCAKHIARNQLMNTAAIANEVTAKRYGLEILKHNIESHQNNYTRFLILTKGGDIVDNANKASVSMRVKHESNALASALGTLAIHNINISKIQSVPIENNHHEYSFHMDLEWQDYKAYQLAMKALEQSSKRLKILGEYRKAIVKDYNLN
jgi:prephenate dehydratase